MSRMPPWATMAVCGARPASDNILVRPKSDAVNEGADRLAALWIMPPVQLLIRHRRIPEIDIIALAQGTVGFRHKSVRLANQGCRAPCPRHRAGNDPRQRRGCQPPCCARCLHFASLIERNVRHLKDACAVALRFPMADKNEFCRISAEGNIPAQSCHGIETAQRNNLCHRPALIMLVMCGASAIRASSRHTGWPA